MGLPLNQCQQLLSLIFLIIPIFPKTVNLDVPKQRNIILIPFHHSPCIASTVEH